MSHDLMKDRVQSYTGCSSSCISTYAEHDSFFWTQADCIASVSDALAVSINQLSGMPVLSVRSGIKVMHSGSRYLSTSGIAFVGFDNYSNEKGVRWLIESVMPNLALLNVTLHIFGSVKANVSMCPNCKYYGNVGETELAQHLVRCRLFVAPIFEPTGISTEILKALSFGVPVLTSREGADGLRPARVSPFLIFESFEFSAFSAEFRKIYFDATVWEQMSTAANSYIKSNYNVDAQLKDVISVRDQCLRSRPRQVDDKRVNIRVRWEYYGCESYNIVGKALRSKLAGMQHVSLPPAGPVDVFVRITWPPNFTRPADCELLSCVFILYTPWEVGFVPKSWLLTNADVVFAESAHHKQMLLAGSGMPATKLFVLPHGVECGRKKPMSLKLRTEYRISADTVVFLYVGSIQPRKGLDILVSAWKQCRQKITVIKSSYVFMETELFERIRHDAADFSSSRIILIEQRLEDIGDVYDMADVLIHPSRAEGFGLTVIEAASRGLVIVTTRESPAREFLSEQAAYFLDSRYVPCTIFPCNGSSYCVFPDAGAETLHCEELIDVPHWHEVEVSTVSTALVALSTKAALAPFKINSKYQAKMICDHFSWVNIAKTFVGATRVFLSNLNAANKGVGRRN